MKHERCGMYGNLVDLVVEDSGRNSPVWLQHSPGMAILESLRSTCTDTAYAMVADNCSHDMVRQECVQRYVPIAVDIGVCAAAARSRDLTLGALDYSFVGNYTTPGCYTYSSGQFVGMAFYSLWEGPPDTSIGTVAKQPPVQLQPWQQIHTQPRLSRVKALRVHDANIRSTQSRSLDGDYIRMPIQCGGHPVYQLGGAGGEFFIFSPDVGPSGLLWPAGDFRNGYMHRLAGKCTDDDACPDADYWILADTKHMQHCTASFSVTDMMDHLNIKRNGSNMTGHDDRPMNAVFTNLFIMGWGSRLASAFVTEVPCDQSDLCCGLLPGGAGECTADVCALCRSSGQCDSCLGHSILLRNGSRLVLGGRKGG